MFLLAAIAGAAAGVLATMVWCLSAPWLADEHFWPAVHQTLQSLLHDSDPSVFVRHYVALLRALSVYLGKTLCRVGMTICPVMLTLAVVSPHLSGGEWEPADGYSFRSTRPLTLQAHPVALLHAVDGDSEKGTADGQQIVVETAGWREQLACSGPHVITSSRGVEILAAGCGFGTTFAPSAPTFVLLRPTLYDRNPLWPFLNDPELVFWASLLGASCIAAGGGPVLRRMPSLTRLVPAPRMANLRQHPLP